MPRKARSQETKLGAAGQVPEHDALFRAHAPGSGHHAGSTRTHIDRAAGGMGQRAVFEGRIDLIRGQFVLNAKQRFVRLG